MKRFEPQFLYQHAESVETKSYIVLDFYFVFNVEISRKTCDFDDHLPCVHMHTVASW